jgi:Tol biopolymer transport system component
MTPDVSPDGRWLAYASDESGSFQIYVCPFPNARDLRVQISTRGGIQPRWAHSGRELFYASTDGYLVAAEVTTQPSFSVTSRDTLFSLDPYSHGSQLAKEYDVTRDDQRFVMVRAGHGTTRFVEIDGVQTLLPAKR